jgi:hypothetical protein
MSNRKALLGLKAKVTAALKSVPVPSDVDRTLFDLNNKVQCSWKGRPCVHIRGKGRGSPWVSYGSDVQAALEAAGLKVYYGLGSETTEGRWVGGTHHTYIEVPLDQERGPFGYDCA